MKIAISIPDEIFKRADRLARRMGISRSQLYSLAVEEFLKIRRPGTITEAMNRVADELGSASDDFPTAAARRVLTRTEWSFGRVTSNGAIFPRRAGRGLVSDGRF